MIVCVCQNVNTAKIRQAVRDGATDLNALADSLGIGTGCGCCADYAEGLVKEELSQTINAYEVV